MNQPICIDIIIPSVFSRFVGGISTCTVPATCVETALEMLVEKYPEMRSQLYDAEGKLLRYLQVFVNDDNIRDLSQLETQLNDGDEILLIAALAGG